MPSLAIFHAQGLYRPRVHANTERDIGFKRSSDGCAHPPSQNSSSGNPALLIGSGSYECPTLQRFRVCTACPTCSCPFQFFTSRYVGNPGIHPQFLLLPAGISQRASRRTRRLRVSWHGALQCLRPSPVSLQPVLALSISDTSLLKTPSTCLASPCGQLSWPPWSGVTPTSTTQAP